MTISKNSPILLALLALFAVGGESAVWESTMKTKELAKNLYILEGAVNTGVLVSGTKALLFDCCDTVTPERLRGLGVGRVDTILCTQHRRPNTAGAYPFVGQGAKLVVPSSEEYLFAKVEEYWSDPKNRWHIYHHQPSTQILPKSLPVAHAVKEGDTVEWEGYSIQVLDTPGATDGSVSYIVEADGKTVCFSGDAIYGPGQLWDFCSLQKGHGKVGDYHGFIGNKFKLVPSLEKLAASGAQMLVPSHGNVIDDPQGAVRLVLSRLDALWRNYTSISCLNHYFPDLFEETKDDPLRMKPVQTHEPPDWVRRVAYTSFAVISDSSEALLIDCGHESVIDKLKEWKEAGTIKSVVGCWVTHYHDDHVDALPQFAQTFGAPVAADQHMAEIVEHPERFFLPCISPNGVPHVRATVEGGSRRWEEFEVTAYHFPGQTYYHGGLLVEGHGKRVFFAGDSGSPTGIDDHCCPNRVFLAAGRGFRHCFEIWRELKPDFIFNQHQGRAFSYTDEELDYMDDMLAKREKLIGEMVPWEDPNFALDEWWVRTYPYDQEVSSGTDVAISVQFTNHGTEAVHAKVEPVLPEGWIWNEKASEASVVVPARTDGSVDGYCKNPDGQVRIKFRVSEGAAPGCYVVPFRVAWGDRYLGQVRHALVRVAGRL